MIEIEQFYLARGDAQQNISKASSTLKDKDKEKHITSIRKQQQDSSRREGAAAKRMQELMRQFATIFRQVSLSFFFLLFMVLGLGCNLNFNDCFIMEGKDTK